MDITDAMDILYQRLFDLPNEAATYRFGQRFAHALSSLCVGIGIGYDSNLSIHSQTVTSTVTNASFPGLHVHLLGAVGAGKTTLVRATLRSLGYLGHVRSPTYTLVEPYSLMIQNQAVNIYHFDLYRFADPAEWIDIGFRDYFNTHALCLVEWPQQAGKLIGIPDLTFTLEMKEHGRQLLTQAFTEIGEICLKRYA